MDSNIEENKVLSNTEYSVILEDRVFLLKYIFNLKIKKIIASLLIREVNNIIIYINEYIIVTIYVYNILNNILRIA